MKTYLKKTLLPILSTLLIAQFAAAESAIRPDWAQTERSGYGKVRRGGYAASATAFGKNYISFGANVNQASLNDYDTNTGAGANFELKWNLFKDKTDTFGIDASVPLMFNWLETSDYNVNGYEFEFPLYISGYYRLRVEKNFELTPFIEAGCGGLYAASENDGYWSDRVNFMWGLGGGVEALIYKKFALTLKYNYSDAPNSNFGVGNYHIGYIDRHTISVEGTYKFAHNWAVSLCYQHWIFKKDNTADLGLVKVRFEL